MEKMDRKEAIRRTALLMGGALGGSLITGVLAGCGEGRASDGWIPGYLTRTQLQVAADLAEVILPETDTPGAKQALTERFIDSMAAGWMSGEEQKLLTDGLNRLLEAEFHRMDFQTQNDAVRALTEEPQGQRFFRQFRQLTLLGFFTSEIGATQVLNYDPIPGIYQGCISLEEAGGRTWA
ncbi:MAG: gluconate 2-dehydrogenase subunit 3 family protein [Balneolaceae bacterium]|jgi:gluconate 2-dehydrogenase gamma chain|nr:MAG: gluconate 2-dehydrogenase subunit 3 family protein [Balneolaceae bacterium]